MTHESEIEFDPVEGHDHDGVSSRQLSHNDLEPGSITADQHHAKLHNLWDNQHHADVSGTPANGDLVYRNSTWQRLAIGASNAVLRVVSGLPSWQNFGHSLLGSDHTDTTGTPATGDLIYRNTTSQWTELTVGSAGRFLRVVSGIPAWATAAFSDLTGVISDAQHGALTTSSSHVMAGDVSGTTATAAVDRVKGKAVTAPVAPADTGKYLKFDGSGLSWDSPAGSGGSHALLSHADAVSASPTAGDLVHANGSSVWARLAVGSPGTFLRVVSGLPAWVSAAFSDLTGAISDAQHGALSTSSSHVVGGDLSGSTASATVAKIQGKSTPAPSAGDDGKLFKYDHASGAFVLSSVNSLATSSAGFQAWRRNSIQNALVNKSEMPGLEGATTGLTMYRGGRIVGCSVDLDSDASNVVGSWYEVEVYKRSPGSAPVPAYTGTGVTARITIPSGNGNNDVSAFGTGSVSFAAGDQITIFDQRSGLGSAVPASKAAVFVVFD